MTIVKGRDGWKAETQYPLSNGMRLDLRTTKQNGNLVTYASAVTPTSYGFTFVLFEDFNECVTWSKVRCTEKSVREQHARAELQENGLIARAEAHYAKKVTA